MEIFKKNSYYEGKSEAISEWIRLLQRLGCDQKIRVFTESASIPVYEGKVVDLTYVDIENFADCGSGGITDIAAKDDVLIITLQDEE